MTKRQRAARGRQRERRQASGSPRPRHGVRPGRQDALCGRLGPRRDQVIPFERAGGKALSPLEAVRQHAPRRGAAPPGLSPERRFRLCAQPELDSTVSVLASYKRAGSSHWLNTTVSTPCPIAIRGRNDRRGDPHWHPSGRFIYASNRGHDSVAVFAFDEAQQSLKVIQHVSTGGTPRDFRARPYRQAARCSQPAIGYAAVLLAGRLIRASSSPPGGGSSWVRRFVLRL